MLHFGQGSRRQAGDKETRTYAPAGAARRSPASQHQPLRPPAPRPDRQPFPRQPPRLPSRGLTRKRLRPAPRPQNSCQASERPPCALHSSNQLPTAHPLPVRRHRATSHLYANYFATWTKVIMLSDRKLTGLKSKMEINNLTPLSDREGGHACWRQPQTGSPAGRLPGRPPHGGLSARWLPTHPVSAVSSKLHETHPSPQTPVWGEPRRPAIGAVRGAAVD